MLTFNLLKQQWLKSFRSKGFYNNLAVNILLGLTALYFAAIFLFIGFFLDDILEAEHASLTPMELFNGAFLYIIIGALFVRFLLQSLNTINLHSYQLLPIKRSTLINLLLIKPLFSPVNYISLLIVIPFALQSVVGYYDGVTAFRFVLSFIFIIWFDSLTAAFLKRKFGTNFVTVLIILLFIAGIVALEYFKVFSLFDISMQIFGFIVSVPFGWLIPLVTLAVAYLLNRWFFSQNYYSEKFSQKVSGSKVFTGNFSFFERFGTVGELIGLEIKLILRHKRTKSFLYLSFFFLSYGLLFYTNDIYREDNGMLFFVAVLITGIFMLMFGQWIIGWDSMHFDGLMTKNVPTRTYIEANYYLMVAFCVVSFALTTPYFYFGTKIIYMHLAAFLFNIGINVFLLLFFATYNTKRIDLSKGSVMNYQGTTFKNFIIVVPIILLPMFLIWVLSLFVSINAALFILGAAGFAGILFHKPLINLCAEQFNNRKYALAEGFRESE